MQPLRFPGPRYSHGMNTLETDIEIGADGSVRLLSPLPAWLKPGRAHVLMTVKSVEEKPKRQKLNPYRDITEPVAWQREMREDRPLPGRD
jgi:hypothetical protein